MSVFKIQDLEIKWEEVKDIFPSLTTRQCEILSCTFSGLNEENTAQTLFISEKTVRAHKSKILKTLRIKDKNILRNTFDKKKNKKERYISKEKFDSFVNTLKISLGSFYERQKSDTKKPR